MLQSCGASLFNEDGTGNIADNEVLKKCVEIYAQMVADGTLVEVTDWDQYISSLNSSTVASTFNGCWILASIQAAEDQSGKWAITNMPRLDDVDECYQLLQQRWFLLGNLFQLRKDKNWLLIS